MAGAYFLAMVLGVPLLILTLALIVGYLYRDHDAGYPYRDHDADVLDWKPTRSPETEARLHSDEIDQLLAAQNELRRRRGAPERSLEQATGQTWST
ncbi:MAG TPA: hypothetical protein VII53_07495 [Solirubrobacteraceae bacterium]